MNRALGVVIALLIVSNVVTLIVSLSGDEPEQTLNTGEADARLAAIEIAVEDLKQAVETERVVTVAPDSRSKNVGPDPRVLDRLESIDDSIRALQKVIELIEVAGVTDPKPAPDFSAEDGYVHASKLVEDGKYLSGAEGLLEFASAHPDHPDRIDLMNKARRALLEAGYRERAIDLQKEIIETDPGRADENYSTLARMYFDDKQYGPAVTAMDSAIDATKDDQQRLWKMMYRAWYIELGDGPAAGIAAYQEVDTTSDSLGVDIQKMKDRINAKISELEKKL